MAALSTRVKATFKTRYGLEFSMTFYVPPGIVDPNDSRVQAVIAAINAVTNAYCFRIEITAANPHAVTPTSSPDYVNEDKAEFVFSGEGGTAHTLKVPGLKAAILTGDNETINALAGTPHAFCIAVTTYGQGAGGETLVQPALGHRRAARKTLKK